MHFYNGIDVDSMDIFEFKQLWNAITMIEAQEMLSQLCITDYPHLKKHKRQQIHRKLSALAYPERKKELMSTREIADYLNRELNGF